MIRERLETLVARRDASRAPRRARRRKPLYPCLIAGCGKPANRSEGGGYGLCRTHKRRFERYGSPLPQCPIAARRPA